MTSPQATAEVFWTAFRAMRQKERQAFLERLIADRGLREDLLEAAVIEARRGEPTRPPEQVLSSPRTKRAARAQAL